MQPTEQQIVEFWEWCGFVGRGRSYTGNILLVAPDEVDWFDECVKDVGKSSYGRMPEKDKHYSPLPIDLNNLFEYAVPKAREYYKKLSDSFLPQSYLHTITPLLEGWVDDLEDGRDPARALFWALWEVKK